MKVPKTLSDMYLIVIYLLGLFEVVLMSTSIIQIRFNIELVDSVWLKNLITLILLIIIVALFYRYLRLTVGRTVGRTEQLYGGTFRIIAVKHRDILVETHDHYREISRLLRNGEYNLVTEYLNSLMSINEENEHQVNVNHPAIAYLLNSKIYEAKGYGVSIHIEVDSTSQLNHIRIIDVIGILGNLLDNAIRASIECGGVEINMSWRQKNHVETLIIENNCTPDASANLTRLFDVDYTTKKDGNGGIGLPIVNKLVNKYKGEIVVEYSHETIRFILIFKSP